MYGAMKTKNTEWRPEEDAELAKAVDAKVSAARLSVRLKRSQASVKRRMRDLGLVGKKRTPRKETDATAVV